MNLNDIRVFTRLQLDVDEEELANELIDVYVRDGYDRIINMETRWPFFEKRWEVTALNGIALVPTDAREIESVVTSDGRLERIDQLHVERMYPVNPTGSRAQFWSQLASVITLHPAPSGDVVVSMRGYREPIDWVSLGAGADVDADIRLHLPIVWYVCSLAYAQQEDEVLEQTYANRFHEGATIAHASIMTAWSGEPKILNGMRAPQYAPVRPALEFVLPPGAQPEP
jgi:hypothetical protein